MFEINLRGTKFSSSSTAVQHLLENLSKNNRAEILADGSYYLDRNPLIFHHILDFYCEGEFHLPRNICPVQAQKEMEFWMIPMTEIPVCCYETLHDDKQAEYKAITLEDEESSEIKHPRTVYSGTCSLTNIRTKLIYALNHPLKTWIGKIWLFIVTVFTAVSIAVFLLESSALFRVPRTDQPNNKTYALFGHNTKLLKIMTTKTSYEIILAELLSNTILMFDLVLRFIISHRKKQFCKKPQNILECMTEMIIFGFSIAEFMVDGEEAVENFSYEVSIWLQILYSLRVIRIFRIIDTSSEMKMLKLSVLKSRNEISLFITVLTSFAFIFGSCVYWAEFLNPDTYPNIFIGIWWAFVTMTTVGYGDFYPKTTSGYLVGVFTSMCGLILLAMPIAMISSNFSKIYDCYNFRKTHLLKKRSSKNQIPVFHSMEIDS